MKLEEMLTAEPRSGEFDLHLTQSDHHLPRPSSGLLQVSAAAPPGLPWASPVLLSLPRSLAAARVARAACPEEPRI